MVQYRLNTIKSKETVSLVIHKYLEGKTMDKIVVETNISKGTVYSIIRDWKNKIGSYNIQEIRTFISSFTKFKITIEQCIQGFRLINILKDFGIDKDSLDNGNEADDIDLDFNDLYSFIFDVYKNCKKLQISSSIIHSWIKDLLDIYYSSTPNSKRLLEIDNANDKINLLSTENKKAEKKIENTGSATFFHKELIQPPENTNNKQLPSQLTTSDSTFFSDNIDIPFTSQVSYFISQKKNEYINLKNTKVNLKEQIKKLVEEKHKSMESLDQLYKKEKFIISYIDWFSNLEKELLKNYSINIRQDIQSFSRLVNNFKEKGYDFNIIAEEYSKSISIGKQIYAKESALLSLENQIINTNKIIDSLNTQMNQHRVTLDIYSHLEGMGFGLKELRQLWDTVLEISEANKISYKDAVSKFLKDVKEDYDKKLGFEHYIKEKDQELTQIKNLLNAERIALQFQPFIVPTLQNLFRKGVSEQDIIDMSALVTRLDKYNNIDTSFSSNDKKDGVDVKTNKEGNLSEIDNNNNNTRSRFWKSVIDQLVQIQDINLEIQKQQENYTKLQKKVSELNVQRQDIYNQCQNALFLFLNINNRVSLYKEFIDYLNKDVERKINSMTKYSPLFIFIENKNTENKNKGEPSGDK